MGKYTYLEDEAIADVAFLAESATLSDLFYQAGMATSHLQTDLSTLKESHTEEFELVKGDIERLLKAFLGEILYFKDADLFFVKDIEVEVTQSGDQWKASVKFVGDFFDEDVHPMHNDLKAITYHGFYVKETNEGWESYVLIDI